MGLELSGSFALDSMGWAKWNDFYNSEQVTKWNVMALLGQLKGGIFFFFNVPYLFWLKLADLRITEVIGWKTISML